MFRKVLLQIALIGCLGADAYAQPQADPTNYLRNIIKRVKESPGVQTFPAVQENPPPGNTPTSTTFTTTTTLPAQTTQPVSGGSSIGPAKIYEVRHGQLPTDRRYWQFLRYYKNQSVVSLVVSAANRESLASSLNSIVALQKRGIQIGEVIITNGALINLFVNRESVESAEDLKQIPKDPALTGLAAQAGLKDGIVEDASDLVNRLGIRYSPTWIVRNDDIDYVYEGATNVERYFTRDGIFTDTER